MAKEGHHCEILHQSLSQRGTAQMLVVQTGKATVFGQIAQRLSLRPPETEFERGVRRFGNLLTQVMLGVVMGRKQAP